MAVKANRLSVLIFFCFFILFCNLVRMQILKGAYYHSLSERNRIRVIFLEGPRGRILDRNGGILAANRLSFNCSAIPRQAKRRLIDRKSVV